MAAADLLRHPFSTVGMMTVRAGQGAQILDLPDHMLGAQQDLVIRSQMRWLVYRIRTRRPTQEVFDLLWHPMLAKGFRRLSVRRGAEQDALHALIHKADQAKLDPLGLPEELRPEAAYEVLKPGRGLAGCRAIEQFVRAWFADAQEITSNFSVAEEAEAPVDVEELFQEVRDKSQADLHFEWWRAKLQAPQQRDPATKAFLAGKAEISALRRAEQKCAAKRQLTNSTVFHVGSTGSKLVYPRDFPTLPRKTGKTWDHGTRKDVELPFAAYVDTRMHFEKALVLWGSAGRQKSPAAAAVANHLAENYDVGVHCKASSPDALKPAQEYFGKCVPVILEELRADDVSQHGRKMSSNYLKQLFEIRDGGQCRVRNTFVCFHPLQPKTTRQRIG